MNKKKITQLTAIKICTVIYLEERIKIAKNELKNCKELFQKTKDEFYKSLIKYWNETISTKTKELKETIEFNILE